MPESKAAISGSMNRSQVATMVACQLVVSLSSMFGLADKAVIFSETKPDTIYRDRGGHLAQ
jgi:hypothetical protein